MKADSYKIRLIRSPSTFIDKVVRLGKPVIVTIRNGREWMPTCFGDMFLMRTREIRAMVACNGNPTIGFAERVERDKHKETMLDALMDVMPSKVVLTRARKRGWPAPGEVELLLREWESGQ